MAVIDPALQAQSRAVWSAGNWDEVAPFIEHVGGPLLDALGLEPGMRLLDVGAGSGGNVAIPAALRGASVVASDLVADHFEAGRRRAAAAGVELDWVEADALDLPFPDASFDRVTSTFGHMFAPDHRLAASELARVCRPGGAVGLACWTPEGVIGDMFRIQGGYMPPPPPGFESPLLWGSEEHVRGLLEPLGLQVACERRVNVFEYDDVAAYSAHMDANFGPLVTARGMLGERWADLKAELDRLFEAASTGSDGRMRYEGEYLQTVARKAA